MAQLGKFELIVEIRRGHELAEKKLIGSNSIYVAIDCNGETKRTRTIDDTLDPIWDESFVFELKDIPDYIELRVRDDRTLLPNLNLGSYKIPIKEKFNNLQNHEPIVIENGEVKLNDVTTGRLNIRVILQDPNWKHGSSEALNSQQSSVYSEKTQVFNGSSAVYSQIDKTMFETLPSELSKDVIIKDDHKDDLMINDKNEVHVLPTIHVEEQPIIIEKEIEYIKPVEVHQTIIHKVKPVVVEKPIIIEKHEHYRTPVETIHQQEKVVHEKIGANDVGNMEEQAIAELKARRKAEFNDKTPIITHEKEQILLNTEVQTKPTQVHEKEVIYEQPIEIERKEIEKIQPVVVENVTLEKEHIHQKVEPTIITQDVKVIAEDPRFYAENANAKNIQNSQNVQNDINAQSDINAQNDINAHPKKVEELQ